MAEITWKSTFVGALLLFLIGIITATCLNYAGAALTSISAGVSGPFRCVYNASDPFSRRNCTTTCNETDLDTLIVENCTYIYVTYYPKGDLPPVKHIKLTPSYRYNNQPTSGKRRFGEVGFY